MTPVERLEAAIKRLEQLRDAATPKPWHAQEDDLTNEVDVWHDQEWRSHVANVGVAGEPRVIADAELVATLHRTIDAQLAILRDSAERYSGRVSADWVPISPSAINALALADAVLGGRRMSLTEQLAFDLEIEAPEWVPIYGDSTRCRECGAKSAFNRGGGNEHGGFVVCDECAYLDRCRLDKAGERYVSHWGDSHPVDDHDRRVKAQAKRRAKYVGSLGLDVEGTASPAVASPLGGAR